MSANPLTFPRPEIKISEGISTAILLFVLMFSLTGSIISADWTDGLGVLPWAGTGALILGYTLAKLKSVRGSIAHMFAAVIAVPIVTLLLTTLLPDTFSLVDKIIFLRIRVWRWLIQVATGGTGADGLIFVVQLTFLTWFLGYFAAWFVYRRHQVWGALAPTGIAVVLNLFYAAPQSGLYFDLFLLAGLLLLVRMNLRALEFTWRRAAVGYTADISFDFMTYGTLFTLLLIALVWFIPASAPNATWFTALDPLQETWQGLEDHFSRWFSTLRASARAGSAGFANATLTMGGPIRLGQTAVMDAQSIAPRYWRATTYDQYTGSGWQNTHLDTLNLGANDARLDLDYGFLRVEVTQTIKLYTPEPNLLYAQAQPLRFSLPTEASLGRPASNARLLDLAALRSRKPLRSGETYTVVSTISFADEDSLRGDATEYAPWIVANYLTLPDAVPARVRNLAQELTRTATNPYDKAVALENYLRATITYNENVSAPPANRDGVDYTLFERPEGYCNYYASAMVVLARLVGVPARVVSGYTTGELRDGAYRVVEANAHSWVEVYFPNFGWVEFEPTASRPVLERPKRPTAAPNDPAFEQAAEAERRRRRELADRDEEIEPGAAINFAPVWWFAPRDLALGAGAGIVMLIAAVLIARRRQHIQTMERWTPAARIYEEMLNHARWLGVRDAKHATPLERAHAIARVLPQARAETEAVAATYTRERFSAHALDAPERAALLVTWHAWQSAWRLGVSQRLWLGMITPLQNFFTRTYAALERLNHRGEIRP